MGIGGMVAKFPSGTYRRSAHQRKGIHAVNELAAFSLILPPRACGHLGDILGDKLIRCESRDNSAISASAPSNSLSPATIDRFQFPPTT